MIDVFDGAWFVHDGSAMRLLLISIVGLSACAPKPAAMLMPNTSDDGGLGATDGGTADGGASCQPACTSWTNPRALGDIVAPVVELSGLAASRTQPGVLYAHNDSGDSARFFALSATNGNLLQEFSVQGATNRDWEDMAVGPCATGSCLFIGDIGDNNRVRTDYAIYVIPEPVVVNGGADATVPGQRLPYQYPMGARNNAEALVVDPASGRPYVLTKAPGSFQPSVVYRFPMPLTPGTQVTLEEVATLPVPGPTDSQLTAADLSPCGDALLLRMYNRLVLMRSDGGSLESIFSATPIAVPAAQEGQGEAVAFAADGRSYFTASEAVLGAPPLFQLTCR